MRRMALCCVAMLALSGCYTYRFRHACRQWAWGVDPSEQLVLARTGGDARDQREAMIRLSRMSLEMKGEEREKFRRLVRAELLNNADPETQPEAVVRVTAVAELRVVGAPEDAAVLAGRLSGGGQARGKPETEPAVRRELVKTLAVLGSADQQAALAEVLKQDRDVETRVEAAYALARVCGRAAAPALIAGLADQSENVTFACWDGLKTIAGRDLGTAESTWRAWWEKEAQAKPEAKGA